MSKLFPLLIGNELVSEGATFPVEDPSDTSLVGLAMAADEVQLERAVQAAKAAWPAWAGLSMAERARCLMRAADLLEEPTEELALLYSREQGKPLPDARVEYGRVLAYLRSYAAMAPLIRDELADASPQCTSFFAYQPIGVVGLIIPWNSPLVLAAIKLPAALLAGNTVLLKPPSYVPLSLLRIGQIIKNAFPPGVINFLAGSGAKVGRALVDHPDIGMISFTGDSETGKDIQARAAVNLKRLTLELGGNDPAIFLSDAPLDDEHLGRLISACFRNAGQVCMATKRIYVHKSIYDVFLDWFGQGTKQLKVGKGTEDGVDLGPVNNLPQLEYVERLVAQAKEAGATVICGGGRPEDERLAKGYFHMPTVIATSDDSLELVKEEQFGPAVPVLPFNDEDEVIARANNCRYGLGGSVWSRDLARAQVLARRLQAGVVWINAHSSRFLGPQASYGGFKESGVGVEKGLLGLKEYLNRQTLSLVH